MINQKELDYRENDILIITKKSLTWRQLEHYRNNLTSRIGRLTQELVDTENKANEIKQQIKSSDDELTKLRSKEVEDIINQQKENERLANQRALDLLREHIGTKAYLELTEKHRIFWTHKDTKYKMNDKGSVFRKEGKEWKQLCIIKPRQLPLPDSILAILVSVKDNPSRFPNRRRR